MSLLDDRMQERAADKAQALGEIAAVLAMIDSNGRDPEPWERLCLVRAFALVSSGLYMLASLEARAASLEPPRDARDFLAEPILDRCDLPTLFEALKEAMAEEPRLYPHLGPTALG